MTEQELVAKAAFLLLYRRILKKGLGPNLLPVRSTWLLEHSPWVGSHGPLLGIWRTSREPVSRGNAYLQGWWILFPVDIPVSSVYALSS